MGQYLFFTETFQKIISTGHRPRCKQTMAFGLKNVKRYELKSFRDLNNSKSPFSTH